MKKQIHATYAARYGFKFLLIEAYATDVVVIAVSTVASLNAVGTEKILVRFWNGTAHSLILYL